MMEDIEIERLKMSFVCSILSISGNNDINHSAITIDAKDYYKAVELANVAAKLLYPNKETNIQVNKNQFILNEDNISYLELKG